MSTFPATRLLSFLSLVQNVLANEGAPEAGGTVLRTVNYHKGLARMTLGDKGSIALQSYTLADGQICVKVGLNWAAASTPGSDAIYPRENFDWLGAAHRIAQAWLAGPQATLSPSEVSGLVGA